MKLFFVGLKNQTVSVGEAILSSTEIKFDIRILRITPHDIDESPIYVQNFAVIPIEDIVEDTVEVFATAIGGSARGDGDVRFVALVA